MQATFTKITLACAAAMALAGTAYAEDQTVKIGVTGPLSGPNAFIGKDNENGVRLAVEDLNAKKMVVGGKTLKFELESEDDQCDPKAGVSVAQKLVDGSVKYVMGPYCSGVAIPASRVYSQGGVVLSTAGSNPKVTMGGYKNLFRIMAGDNEIGARLAFYAANIMKVKNVAVIDDRTAYGQGLADEFSKEAKKLGLNIVGQEFTTDKATDFSAILTSLKAKNPDVILLGGYAPQAGPMLRQMKSLGINAKLLGGDAICTAELGKLAGEAATDTAFCAQGGAVLEKTAEGPAFKAKYKKRFNVEPDAYAPSFYDQTMFIGQSMQKAGSVDPEKVGAEIYKTSYKGMSGTFAFDDKGNLKSAPITIYTFKAGAPSALGTY